MSHQLDWQVCDDDRQWDDALRVTVSPGDHAVAARRTAGVWHLRHYRRAALLVLLLALAGFGYHTLRQADAEMDRVENEVRAAVAADSWVETYRAQTASPMGTPLPSPAQQQAPLVRASPKSGYVAEDIQGLEVGTGRVEVRDGYAMVEVWTYASALEWMPTPYRQTRFFRETARGWQPTEPPDLFWQPLERHQAGRFTFVYGPRDASAVFAAAHQVGGLDAEIRAELELPPTGAALTIRIIPGELLRRDPVELMSMSADATLYLPSPALLRLPAPISEGDAMLQLVAGLLIQQGLDEMIGEPGRVCPGQRLIKGLRLWLLARHSTLPSAERAYTAWFTEHQAELGFRPRLAWFSTTCPPSQYSHILESREGAAIAASFVEYALSTYGGDRLPALLRAMHDYDSWDGLIPAVFGVSADEMEAGWQESLQKGDAR